MLDGSRPNPIRAAARSARPMLGPLPRRAEAPIPRELKRCAADAPGPFDLDSVVSVRSEDRLRRLRELLDQLERLPASAERDRMLREVRGRVVDVDTGVAPRELQPVEPEEAMRAAGRLAIMRPSRAVTPTPADEAGQPRATPLPAPLQVSPGPTAPVASREVTDDGSPVDARDRLMLVADELLSLDEYDTFSPSEAQSEPPPAWTRGLRG